MTVLSGLLNDTLGRVEELNPPTFWSLSGEVYVQMVYAMYEAAILTGNVQQSSVVVTLVAGATYFNLQGTQTGYNTGGYGEGPYGGALAPRGMLAPIRIRSPYPIRKTSLKSLDDMNPKWQQEEPGPQIKAWFPLGLSLFGIYPQLSDDTNILMDFIASPVNSARPYTGNEPTPFQHEFNDLISKYAAAMLRSKEGGAEAEEADTVFKDYTATLKDLSLFQQRIDSLILTRSLGGNNGVNPRTQV